MDFLLFKKKHLSYDEIKKFLIDHIDKEIDDLDIVIKGSIKKFIIDHVNSLIESNGGAKEYKPLMLPSWSDKELVNQAYFLMEYQGLLITFHSADNRNNFENNYRQFINPYQEDVHYAIKNGNLFIAYLHVVKLCREMDKLNNQLCDAAQSLLASSQKISLFNAPESVAVHDISGQIDTLENELISTSTNILNVTTEENQFWASALIALILHTRASIFYNANNPKCYDLEKAKQLLSMTMLACDEGESALQHLNDKNLIIFYTLHYSLLPTLPYPSFAEQKEAILKTGLLALTADDQVSNIF